MSARIFQLNLNRRYAATADLDNRKENILLLTEPYVGKPIIAEKRKWYSISHDARASIYVRDVGKAAVMMLSQYSGKDMCTIEISLPKKNVIFCSVYADAKIPNLPEQLGTLCKYCRRNNKSLIIGIDSNSHSPAFGARDLNSRGKMMEDFILEHGLCVENVGDTPTFVRQVQGTQVESVIDLTLTLNIRIHNWKVIADDYSSDHKPITYSLGAGKPEKVYKRVWSKANWILFQADLECKMEGQNWGGYWSQKLLEERCNWFTNAIIDSLNVACPLVHIRARRGPTFWNEECEIARTKLRMIQRKEHRKGRPTQEGWARIKETQRDYNRLLRKRRTEAWNEFTSSVKDYRHMARICRSVKGDSNIVPTTITRNNGTKCESITESNVALMEEHFPGATLATYRRPDEKYVYCKRINWLSIPRLRDAINQFKPYSGEGLDEIKPVALQKLPPLALEKLIELFNACISLAYTPTCWLKAKVIFIPKPGRTEGSSPRSWRPISLMSYLLKTLERLVLYRLEETALKDKPIHKNQFAFRKQHSVEHALSRFMALIEKGKRNGQFVMATLMDIQGAFDTILNKSIINALKKRKASTHICEWYNYLLCNRTVVLDAGDGTLIERGGLNAVPQGGVMSGNIGWNCPFDEVAEIFDNSPTATVLFADDLALVVAGICPHTVRSIMQSSVNKCTRWASVNGLRFSASKSVVLTWSKMRKLTLEPILMYNESLSYVKHAKYLGVTFDNNLAFKDHVINRCNKARGLLMRAKSMLSSQFGPKPKYQLWMYESIIKPMIMYGAIVWQRAINRKTLVDFLNKIQYLALKQVTPVRRSTPRMALEAIYGVAPIDLEVMRYAQSTWARIRWGHLDDGLLFHGGHRAELESEMPKILVDNGTDKHAFYREWLETKVNYTSAGCWAVDIQLQHDSWSTTITTYILRNGNYVFEERIGTWNSLAYNLELIAVQRVAEWLLENADIIMHVVITVSHASSRIAITAHNVRTLSAHMARESLCKLRRRGFSIAVTLKSSNSRCITTNRNNVLWIACPLTDKTVRKILKTRWWSEWNKRWRDLDTCRQSKAFIKTILTDNSQFIKSLNRQDTARVIRHLTGHSFYKRHENLCGNCETTECRLCGQGDKTPMHLILECRMLSHHRDEIFGGDLECPPWDKVLKFANLDIMRELEADCTVGESTEPGEDDRDPTPPPPGLPGGGQEPG